MGQSNSRGVSSRQQSTSHVRDTTTNSTNAEASGSVDHERNGSQVSTAPPTSAAVAAAKRRSRRSSLRKSVVDFVTRSSSSGSSSSSTSNQREEVEEPSTPSSARPTSSLRKKWRLSKRFSKLPASSELNDVLTESSEQRGDVEDVERNNDNDDQSRPAPAMPSAQQTSSRPPTPFPSSRPTTPVQESFPEGISAEQLSERHQQASQNIASWLSGSSSPPSSPIVPSDTIAVGNHQPSAENIEQEIDQFLIGSSDPVEEATPSLADSPIPSATSPVDSPNATTQPRHFPPPGTLVVVQGVVNTSDTPSSNTQSSSSRPPNTSNSASENLSPPSAPVTSSRSVSMSRSSNRSAGAEDGPIARNGLSSLLPRPSGMIRRRRVSESQSGSTTRTPSNDPRRSADLPSLRPQTSSSEESPTSSSDAETPNTSPAESENGHRALSQGSIDVLGTLLSVAATATAASLFSPTLTRPSALSSSPEPQSPSATRPTSPTPTAGLGGFSSLSGLTPETPISSTSSSTSERDARERIRSVWENFRERLGLSRGAPNAMVSPDAQSPDDQGPRIRPGELMLAEMARALNAGLGLASQNSSQTERPPAPPTGSSVDASTGNLTLPSISDAARPMSPDPGFESFLLNLQADLRRLLSEDAPQEPTTSSASSTSDAEFQDASSTPQDRWDDLPFEVEDHEDESDPGAHGDSSAEADDEDDAEDTAEEVVEEETLQRPEVGDTGHHRTPTPMPSTSIRPDVPSMGQDADTTAAPETGDDRRRPAINLWRIYRFQPIPAPQPQGHGPRTTPASNSNTTPSSPATHSSPLPSSTLAAAAEPTPMPFFGRGEGTSEPSSGQSEESESAEASSDGSTLLGTPPVPSSSTSAPGVDLSVVIPVIVVGLQSVDGGQDHDSLHEQGPTLPHDIPAAAAAAATDAGIPDSLLNTPVPSSTDDLPSTMNTNHSNVTGRASASRGRTWQSRAASALRTLRPGRRTSRTRRNSENAGSRTFLIYVIGGYYPPNHHMVTGSDTLDSYEALWELAELLGQVKPPTATKEDIDGSGLQVIKASELKRYEQEKKITSNCVERCLVCLDDYEDTQDVRLMSCKHAFHKQCVDRWMQIGRNNCPACRTKGVSTSHDSEPEAPSVPP